MPVPPLVSICIPVYNGGNYILQAIESVLAQNYENLEIIVVDNASSDNTATILKSFSDDNPGAFQYSRNEKVIPMADNFNLAVSLANGEYIKVLPHDDILLKNSIVEMMKYADSKNRLIVGDRGYIFEQVNLSQRLFYLRQNLNWRIDRHFKTLELSADDYLRITAKNPCHNMFGEPGSVLFSAKAFQSVGGFDSSFHQLCDLQLWHKIGSRYGICLMPQRVSLFRVHQQSESSKKMEDGRDNSLYECLRLSTFITNRCYRTGAEQATKFAIINYLLDRARFTTRSDQPDITDTPNILSDPILDNTVSKIAALPIKRIYQLIILRMVYFIFSLVNKKAVITPRT